MPQQQSPWLEAKYGWNFGESNWNTGVDENLLKFSFLFDRNVDGVVSTLPAAVNGKAYFLTTDKRLYFTVNTTYFSCPTPKWFEFVVRGTGVTYQFDGTNAVQVDSASGVDSRLDAVELSVASLGTASTKDIEFFATTARVDVVEANTQSTADRAVQVIGEYAAGLVLRNRNQGFRYLEDIYLPGDGITLPYTTTGVGAAEVATFRNVGDAILRGDLAAPTGATLVSRGGSTVSIDLTNLEARALASETDIDNLQASAASSIRLPALIGNAAAAGIGAVCVIGDSISHGAFSLNIFNNSWPRIMGRMVNAELGNDSYGFVPLLNIGAGPTLSSEIHSVFFAPDWEVLAHSHPSCQSSWAGSAFRSPAVGAEIQISLPFFQNRARIHYIRQPGGGTFTVSVNGVVTNTVATSGALSHQYVDFALTDAGYGTTAIVIKQTVAGSVDIVGPSYYSAQSKPSFENFSDNGRRLNDMSESAISTLIATAGTLIMALGHNDQFDADSSQPYFDSFKQRINWLIQYSKAKGTKVIVPDFCWTAASASRARAELNRLATETGGIYINLPKMIFGSVAVSDSYLIDTLKMWTDASHPNVSGHKWVAETISRHMGLSCSSKRSALRDNDYWMPITLTPATLLQNASLVTSELTSAYKRSGDNIVWRVYIKKNDSPIPVGGYSITAGYNPKSELFGSNGKEGVGTLVNANTGLTSSIWSINASGAMTLIVHVAEDVNLAFNLITPADSAFV